MDMNINVYLEDSIFNSLNNCAKKSHKSRNAIIREALKQWLAQYEVKQWPKSILNFSGIDKLPSFESYRKELLLPKEDPFK